MIYLIIFITLFLLELVYFKVADHFNIIDKPNERSSHSTITLRGGGIIFYIGALLYFVWSGFQYPCFFLGLTLMTIVSFADDVMNLSNKLRLIVHFTSVILLAYELQIFNFPWYYLLISFIFIVGVVNAYNFMDGINGITAGYSLAVGALLIIVNHSLAYIDKDLLLYSLIGVFVFAFFNFRNKAKCFAGDVGSVSIAFILLFALGSLILKTGNFIYILFLAVYGIETIWTIIQRVIKRENIFNAHRSHLYQYLANEMKCNKLLVSFLYSLLQFIIGLITIYVSSMPVHIQFIYTGSVIGFGSLLYLMTKSIVYKRYVIKENPLI